MKLVLYIAIFISTFSFYWSSSNYIENRTEAEDVYEYALMIEDGKDHPWFFHKHHLIYAPLIKGFYETVKFLGSNLDSLGIMRLVSSLSAVVTLFFFFLFCYKRFSLRPVSSLLATVFYGFSYGFWRYAAEAEIPLLASAFITSALYFATAEKDCNKTFTLTIFVSVLAVLIHIMNAVAVFIAIPMFYLFKKRTIKIVLHLSICLFFVISTYIYCSNISELYGNTALNIQRVSFGSFFKGMIAFIECIISSDFVMGYRSVRAFLLELFAGRVLLEEVFYGERLVRSHVLFSTFTFFAFFILLLICVFRSIWVWRNTISSNNHLPDGIKTLLIPILFFLGYGAVLLFIEPGNPELWVMGLMPFCLLLCGTVFLPLTEDNKLWLPLLMILILLLHNSLRMQQLKDPIKDYQKMKTSNILKIATQDDVIITAGNPVFERYLRYHFPGEVLYFFGQSESSLRKSINDIESGNIFILGDALNIHRSLLIRFPKKCKNIKTFIDTLNISKEPAFNDDFGGMYLLNKND